MKKILSIIALCLIAVLAGAIIVFACIDKDFNPNLKAPEYIKIHKGSEEVQSYFKNDANPDRKAVYDKVMELYNDSFKQKVMSSIFQGTIFDKTEVSYGSKSIESIKNSGTVIEFVYNFDDQQSVSYDNKTENYTTLFIEVKNTTAMTDINIYVKRLDSAYSYYRYTVKANQSELYEYLQEYPFV